MTSHEQQGRWPLTGNWYTGPVPWTYEVSQQLSEMLSNLGRENHTRLQWARKHRDMAVVQECHHRQQYLWACRDELIERDKAAIERSARDHRQWRGGRHYSWSRTHLLTRVLCTTRAGTLALDWRNHLSANLADYHRTIGINGADVIASVVIQELATMPPQPWEPYVTDGDWRAALDAWYRDSLALTDWCHQQDRAFQSSRPERLGMFLPHFAAERVCHEATDAECAALKHARDRDALEASYRAGLATGGDDEDWAGWYRSRIIDTWHERDDQLYDTLFPKRDFMLDWLEAITPQTLPDYWTQRAS